jgi:hypothetical protein
MYIQSFFKKAGAFTHLNCIEIPSNICFSNHQLLLTMAKIVEEFSSYMTFLLPIPSKVPNNWNISPIFYLSMFINIFILFGEGPYAELKF